MRAVQPEDVLPGDIDARLVTPWIPESDLQAFAAELFGVAPGGVKVAPLKRDAAWSFEVDDHAHRSVAATTDFGTPRADGTWLFDLPLTMIAPASQGHRPLPR